MSIEKNYKSLNEEVDEMKVRFKEIKNKYVANLQELKDIQNEHEDEKEDLLDTIREQEKEIKKFSAILAMLMTPDQIDHIVNNSEWNEEKKEWHVPYFTYKEKNMGLPKLANTGMGRRDEPSDRDKKEIVFKATSQRDVDKLSSDPGFRVNNILKNAREGEPTGNLQSMKSVTIVNHTQLTPLKNDTYEKARGPMQFEAVGDRKKVQKLNPISGGLDSKKHL